MGRGDGKTDQALGGGRALFYGRRNVPDDIWAREPGPQAKAQFAELLAQARADEKSVYRLLADEMKRMPGLAERPLPKKLIRALSKERVIDLFESQEKLRAVLIRSERRKVLGRLIRAESERLRAQLITGRIPKEREMTTLQCDSVVLEPLLTVESPDSELLSLAEDYIGPRLGPGRAEHSNVGLREHAFAFDGPYRERIITKRPGKPDLLESGKFLYEGVLGVAFDAKGKATFIGFTQEIGPGAKPSVNTLVYRGRSLKRAIDAVDKKLEALIPGREEHYWPSTSQFSRTSCGKISRKFAIEEFLDDQHMENARRLRAL